MVAWDSLLRNAPSEALVYAQKAIAEEPGLSIAHLVLGRAPLDTGDVKGGLELLERNCVLIPTISKRISRWRKRIPN
jgi:hypothetical protein